jgi:hypothetical protein
MADETHEREVQALLAEIRVAFAAQRGFHFSVGARSHIWIVPSFVVQPELPPGFLICLEGRGSLYIDRPDWGDKFTLVRAGIGLGTAEILAGVLTRLMQPQPSPTGLKQLAAPPRKRRSKDDV